jgi:gliding motility-associated-like protein
LKAGVPDLGAYEFTPVATPPACVATPAAPVANSQQVFKLGTDVVTTINWGASVPTGVTIKRYSGVMPAGYTGTDYMYFYTDVAVTGGAYTADINQNYLDPWRGFIDNEERIRLGKTDVSNNWTVDATSTVNSTNNVIAQTGLTYLGRFTGLTNGTIPYPASDSVHHDTTNMGTRFWVGYGHNYYVSDFVVKIGGAAQDANVTVKVHGTDWVRNYFVPANTFVFSDPVPRTGSSGAVLLTEGLSDRGISIESDVPVAAYAEANGILPVTGSTMLLPVSSYGYEYYALAWAQKNIDINLNVFSWMHVIADHDSTLVEITPTVPTYGGRAPKVPFVITLNKGEVYQLFGAIETQDDCYDLAGTKVRSLSNASGKCYPVGVFSGNSYAYVDCSERFNPNGAYLIQQALPAETWGTKYVTMPTSVYGDATTAQTNFYRILVKDPNTTVRKNGQIISPINNFYQYQSNTADYIEADKPIAVAEFIPGQSLVCNYGTSTGPEMFYLPSIDQGIHKAVFYRSSVATNWDNFISLVIPTTGLNTLTIDGNNTFDATYPHPNKPGYSIVVKRWHNAAGNSVVQSDSAFIALSYALSNGANTAGVLVGRTVPGIPAQPGITNVYDSSGHFSAFTCVGSPFTYSVLLPIVPTRITWKFSQGAGMVPNADSVQVNPVPAGTVLVNGVSYYRFALNGKYVFNTPGQYTVPIEYVHPIFASCTNSAEAMLTVTVAPTPLVNINFNTTGCAGDTVYMSTTLIASFGDAARLLTWNFGDNTTATALTPAKLYAGGGNYTVKVDAITNAGCIANATKPLALTGATPFTFVSDTAKGCDGTDVLLSIKNPQAGVTYNWYNAATGGTAANTGSSVTVTAIKATRTYYVDATIASCTIKPRKAVTALYLGGITPPVASVDSVGAQALRFKWNAVPGASGYEVSLDGGINWSKPSSGATGLEHLVTGLQPGQTVTIRVKAIDPNGCKDGITEISGTTVIQDVFTPNAFTPNGDNLNDVFKIEGYAIKDIQLRIFNQWGEMIFETAEKSRGWDGTYKGKLQPSGVYMYVCSMILTDGSKVVKKGSVNLVR